MNKNKTDELPGGWVQVALNDIAEILMGQSPPSETYNSEGIGLPFFQGKAEFTDLHPVAEKWCREPNKIADAEDILMSVRAPVGTTNIANQKCCIGRGLAAITYNHNTKFLFYFLRLIERKLDEKGTGTTFKAISGEVLKNIDVPLPPLPEQHAIVSKIEQLFSELDKGIESLKTAQQQLKVYRQSVLKSAFEGKLMEKKSNWVNTTLGNIISISSGDGLTKAARNEDGEYLVYGGNGVAGKHSEYIHEEEKLIIGRVGVHCGNVHITKPKSWITDNAFVVSFDKNIVDRKFLYNLILNLNLNKYSSSTAQPVISQGKIYPIEISLPGKEEQHQIVQEIESRLSECDNMEATIATSLQQAEALRQSILKKAFEGKLLNDKELEAVRQDSTWEPAERLLERIRAEKAVLYSEKKGRKSKA